MVLETATNGGGDTGKDTREESIIYIRRGRRIAFTVFPMPSTSMSPPSPPSYIIFISTVISIMFAFVYITVVVVNGVGVPRPKEASQWWL
ncbi:hypothetical protein Bca4012_029662 [Brassica carinata]